VPESTGSAMIDRVIDRVADRVIDRPAEKGDVFHASGRGTGVAALLLALGALAYGVLGAHAHYADWLWPLLLLAGVVAWCCLLRPRVCLREDELELRNALSTDTVALAAIETIEVRQFTRVRVAGRTLTCAGAGRTRKMIHADGHLPGDAKVHDYSAGAVLESRVRHRSAECAAFGAPVDRPVRRTWAWGEIAALAVLGIATAVLALA
jgi:hypothetical protein